MFNAKQLHSLAHPQQERQGLSMQGSYVLELSHRQQPLQKLVRLAAIIQVFAYAICNCFTALIITMSIAAYYKQLFCC